MAPLPLTPTTPFGPNKILPIVICLDVSASMNGPSYGTKKRWMLQNESVRQLLCQLAYWTKSRETAEIAFIAYSDKIVCESPFMSLTKLNFEQLCCDNVPVRSTQVHTKVKEDNNFSSITLTAPEFRPTNGRVGTYSSPALNCAIEKLELYRTELQKNHKDYYTPFMVFFSGCEKNLLWDNHPIKKAEKDRDIAMLKSKCANHLEVSDVIIPFIVGIGNAVQKTCLREYAAGFPEGYLQVPEVTAYNLGEQELVANTFKLLAKSIADSTACKGGTKDLKNLLARIIVEAQ